MQESLVRHFFRPAPNKVINPTRKHLHAVFAPILETLKGVQQVCACPLAPHMPLSCLYKNWGHTVPPQPKQSHVAAVGAKIEAKWVACKG